MQQIFKMKFSHAERQHNIRWIGVLDSVVDIGLADLPGLPLTKALLYSVLKKGKARLKC